jgi:hypothetical protein
MQTIKSNQEVDKEIDRLITSMTFNEALRKFVLLYNNFGSVILEGRNVRSTAFGTINLRLPRLVHFFHKRFNTNKPSTANISENINWLIEVMRTLSEEDHLEIPGDAIAMLNTINSSIESPEMIVNANIFARGRNAVATTVEENFLDNWNRARLLEKELKIIYDSI